MTGSRRRGRPGAREASGLSKSWYAQEKLSGGGHATFLGVSIRMVAGDPSWEAIAVGDACLFLMNHGAARRLPALALG